MRHALEAVDLQVQRAGDTVQGQLAYDPGWSAVDETGELARVFSLRVVATAACGSKAIRPRVMSMERTFGAMLVSSVWVRTVGTLIGLCMLRV
jgi:hypothetical protein